MRLFRAGKTRAICLLGKFVDRFESLVRLDDWRERYSSQI